MKYFFFQPLAKYKSTQTVEVYHYKGSLYDFNNIPFLTRFAGI